MSHQNGFLFKKASWILGSFIRQQKSVHRLDMVWVGAEHLETADQLSCTNDSLIPSAGFAIQRFLLLKGEALPPYHCIRNEPSNQVHPRP